MSPIKSLSVILFASLCFNAANADIDPSKYTVTFKFNDATSWCHGGILGENTLISAIECFANRNGEAFNFTSVKAVVGSIEVDVDRVVLPKFPTSPGKILRDYALVWLREKLNLEANNLTALSLPSRRPSVRSQGLMGMDDGKSTNKYKIVHAKHCLNNVDVNFIGASHLCVQLPNPNDRCLDQLGSPLVVEGKKGLKVIGIYLDCYEDSAHEVFAQIYGGVGKRSEILPAHVYPRNNYLRVISVKKKETE